MYAWLKACVRAPNSGRAANILIREKVVFVGKKALVIGAAGFIGSHLSARLLAQGLEVSGLDSFEESLYPSAARKSKISRLKTEGLEFVELDAVSVDWGSLLRGVDVVYNMAAVPGLSPSWDKFPEYNHSNLTLVAALLKGLSKFPSSYLVHASTSSVYGEIVNKNSSEKPNSPYGVTKLAAEHLIRAYSDAYGIRYSILRYFSVYGPEPRPDQFFAILLDKLSTGQTIEIFGDGLNSRTNTYVDDLVDATLLAGNTRAEKLTVDICGIESATTLEIVEMVAAEMHLKPSIRHVPSRIGDQRSTSGSGADALKNLGWSPKTSLKDGIAEMVRVFQKGT